MARERGGKKSEEIVPDESQAQKKKSTLKVDTNDSELVGKVAAMRGLSVEKLFKESDVQEFFTHLLLAEMEKEAIRLRAKKKL